MGTTGRTKFLRIGFFDKYNLGDSALNCNPHIMPTIILACQNLANNNIVLINLPNLPILYSLQYFLLYDLHIIFNFHSCLKKIPCTVILLHTCLCLVYCLSVLACVMFVASVRICSWKSIYTACDFSCYR